MVERSIEPHWIEMALVEPDRKELDSIDPTALHALKRIVAMDNRILRVVYNAAVTPVRIISVYFDRGMKGKL